MCQCIPLTGDIVTNLSVFFKPAGMIQGFCSLFFQLSNSHCEETGFSLYCFNHTKKQHHGVCRSHFVFWTALICTSNHHRLWFYTTAVEWQLQCHFFWDTGFFTRKSTDKKFEFHSLAIPIEWYLQYCYLWIKKNDLFFSQLFWLFNF